ncbi:response regulator [Dyadobacter crusticola]|uniref:response regulator n=1 Tax=Dyadobacter crusticola TaxID=292407 RepID=UPI0004E227F7|nr:response regulator transcription factor [Dyadobacter crusticola]
MNKVLIVEDHVLIRMSLRLMLQELDKEVSIHEVDGFNEAMQQTGRESFDLILLDINIPGGMGTQMPALLREKQPAAAILVCSSLDEEQHALRYLQSGADGYLSKTASKEETMSAISSVMHGQKYISDNLQSKLLEQEQQTKKTAVRLSAREREIMYLLIEGKWTKEIAHELNISGSTVSTFKARIFEKANVTSVMELFVKVNAGEVE